MLLGIFLTIKNMLEFCEWILGLNTGILCANSTVGSVFLIVPSGTKKLPLFQCIDKFFWFVIS